MLYSTDVKSIGNDLEEDAWEQVVMGIDENAVEWRLFLSERISIVYQSLYSS